jgi:hypothetical protein
MGKLPLIAPVATAMWVAPASADEGSKAILAKPAVTLAQLGVCVGLDCQRERECRYFDRYDDDRRYRRDDDWRHRRGDHCHDVTVRERCGDGVVADRCGRSSLGGTLSLGSCIMSGAFKRAECYHDFARRYLRLAASTENPYHYLRIAVQYNALAEAEELSPSHGDGDWHFDRFDLTDGVLARPTSQGTFPGPSPLRSSLPLIHDRDALEPV